MVRRAVALVVLVILALPALCAAAATEPTPRVPSAQLQADGSGTITITGRFTVNGTLAERSTIDIVDRARDAKAVLGGVPIALDRRGRAKVRRAQGILIVTGSNFQVTINGKNLNFSVAGNGRGRLIGKGSYRLNGGSPLAWGRSWIRISPPPPAHGRKVSRCADCSSSPVSRA
ncbi:MAG: hypothetical protein AB7V42_09385 [Thermoleophilia bacterium]